MESKKYPPYLFDLDFDALSLPPEPEVVEELPPPPTFSEAELEAARSAAFESGKAEGTAQANAGFEYQITEAVAALQRGFTAISAAQYAANHETMRDTVRVAASIMRKLLPTYARQHGVLEVEEFVKSTISTLFAEAELVIRVPEALADEISTRLTPAAAAAGLGESIKIVPDPSLGPADCRMDWGNGGAERNCEELLAEIDSIVQRFVDLDEVPPMAIDLDRAPDPVLEDSPVAPPPAAQADAANAVQSAPTAPDPAAAPENGATFASESAEAPQTAPPEPEISAPPAAEPTTIDPADLEQPTHEALPPEEPEPSGTPAIALPPIEQIEPPLSADTPADTPAPAALPGAIDASASETSN